MTSPQSECAYTRSAVTNALTYYHSARPPSFGPFYFAVALDTMFYGIVLCLSALYITTSRK